MLSNRVLHIRALKGIRLAVEKVIKEAQEKDDYLVFSKNGKIVRIKARKLKRRT
jgi:hypothetical protein